MAIVITSQRHLVSSPQHTMPTDFARHCFSSIYKSLHTAPSDGNETGQSVRSIISSLTSFCEGRVANVTSSTPLRYQIFISEDTHYHIASLIGLILLRGVSVPVCLHYLVSIYSRVQFPPGLTSRRLIECMAYGREEGRHQPRNVFLVLSHLFVLYPIHTLTILILVAIVVRLEVHIFRRYVM